MQHTRCDRGRTGYRGGLRVRPSMAGAIALFALPACTGAQEIQQETDRAWEAIVPEGFERSYERSRYAPAVRMGDVLVLSGVIGYSGGAEDNGPEAQFVRAFERLSAVLDGAGLSLDDVAEITTYHVNLGELGRRFLEVKDRYFDGPPYPAWTAIGVDRLFLDGALIEIRAVAVAPDDDGGGP